jgi:Cft2 family RNA processing exonuclease
MIEWMSNIKNLKNVFIVHGEKNAQTIFQKLIKEQLQIDAHMVKYGQEMQI